jgi:hypothetical protein
LVSLLQRTDREGNLLPLLAIGSCEKREPMNTETPDCSVGTPLENGALAVSHTVGEHYTNATAADAGEAIARDATELAALAEPDYAVPGTHDIVDPESGVALDPDEAQAVAREENEGNSMVTPPQPPLRVIQRIQGEVLHDPEGPTGA